MKSVRSNIDLISCNASRFNILFLPNVYDWFLEAEQFQHHGYNKIYDPSYFKMSHNFTVAEGTWIYSCPDNVREGAGTRLCFYANGSSQSRHPTNRSPLEAISVGGRLVRKACIRMNVDRVRVSEVEKVAVCRIHNRSKTVDSARARTNETFLFSVIMNWYQTSTSGNDKTILVHR